MSMPRKILSFHTTGKDLGLLNPGEGNIRYPTVRPVLKGGEESYSDGVGGILCQAGRSL